MHPSSRSGFARSAAHTVVRSGSLCNQASPTGNRERSLAGEEEHAQDRRLPILMLWLSKGFGFADDWTVNDQNDLFARLFGLQKLTKHESGIVQVIVATAGEVCDKPRPSPSRDSAVTTHHRGDHDTEPSRDRPAVLAATIHSAGLNWRRLMSDRRICSGLPIEFLIYFCASNTDISPTLQATVYRSQSYEFKYRTVIARLNKSAYTITLDC